MHQRFKPFLLLLAFANLLIGMMSGLARMGWQMSLPETYAHHGALMVGGFLGSLIALEKVIPLKKPWLYIGPLLSATSMVVFVAGYVQAAFIMLVLASVIFVVVLGRYLYRHQNLYHLLACAGALCRLVGNVALLYKRFYPIAFPWWMGFLLFTIVSERLELSQFLPVTHSQRYQLMLFMGIFLISLVIPFHTYGTYAAGISVILVSAWLLQHDVLKITLRKEGLVRFTAVALMCGYLWLMAGGFFLMIARDLPMGYDVVVHVFFIGFVFSMIFAHGPIILPGVLGLTIKPYHPFLYLPLFALLVSLLIRVSADFSFLPFFVRKLSGWISAGSILLYFITMAVVSLGQLRYAKSS